MTRRLRWLWVTSGFLGVVGLACGAAGAADKSKVDQATKQVSRAPSRSARAMSARA
jgi:hypothetical protein